MEKYPDQSESSVNLTGGGKAIADRGESTAKDDPPSAQEIKQADWSEFAQLMLLTFIGAMIMVVYVWIVNKYNVQRTKSDVVENASLLAARELAEIAVQQSSFGNIGLCDLPATRYGNARMRAQSIDRIYETLHVDETIANRLNHPLMQKLVRKDIENARKLELELSQKLKQAVEPDSSQTNIKLPNGNSSGQEQDNSVYRDVYRMVSGDREAQQASTLEVKITLGRAKTNIFTRDCPAHSVEPSNFQPTADDKAPYLVRVEAVYDIKDKDKPVVHIHRASCALIAAPNLETPPAAFAINFPSGIPPAFKSAHDLLFFKGWTSNGDWQQAVGSNVPGKGSLAPPLGSVMPSMSPADAMAVALYDWLKSSGPAVDPDRAVQLIQSNWDTSPLMVSTRRQDDLIDSGESSQRINSCLARDTGAREYSIMNQTAPGSTGQTALCRAFSIFDQNTQGLSQMTYPQSALPLVIDKSGNCNLSGRRTFDRTLVSDFLSQVHSTNLAAITSLATAKELVSATNAALNQLEQKMFIEKQELASVLSRVSRQQSPLKLPAKKADDAQDPPHIAELAQQRIATLNAIVEADERQRTKFQRMHRLAVQATINATRVASSTFELGLHAFKLCRDGIYRINEPKAGFLVGKKLVFIPCLTPASETDFATFESQYSTQSPKQIPRSDSKCPWLNKTLDSVFSVETAFQVPADQVKVEGRTLAEIEQASPILTEAASGMIVLNSNAIVGTAQGKLSARGYKEYAFSNIAIPPGQLLYYCQNAIQTGGSPKVAWSVLLRDLVASRAGGTVDDAVGNPIPSQDRDWCGQLDRTQCPGLACELQIRCPLPVLDHTFEDTYLKSPTTNAQIPQIPPVPPDML